MPSGGGFHIFPIVTSGGWWHGYCPYLQASTIFTICVETPVIKWIDDFAIYDRIYKNYTTFISLVSFKRQKVNVKTSLIKHEVGLIRNICSYFTGKKFVQKYCNEDLPSWCSHWVIQNFASIEHALRDTSYHRLFVSWASWQKNIHG